MPVASSARARRPTRTPPARRTPAGPDGLPAQTAPTPRSCWRPRPPARQGSGRGRGRATAPCAAAASGRGGGPLREARWSSSYGVSDSSNGLDDITGADVLELAAKVVHVQVDHLRRRVEREAPYVLLDLRT